MANLTLVQWPISVLPIEAKLSISGSPDWVCIGRNAVWISNKAKNSVARIDPQTNKLVATIAVGRAPCSGLGVGFDGVWVPSCADRTLDRIDAGTNKVVARIPTAIGDREGGIAVDETGIWLVMDRHGRLLHVDATHNEIAGEVQIAPGSFVPAAGFGSIWITSTTGNVVSRFDPHTYQLVASMQVGPSPHFAACDGEAVWTLNQGDGTVSRIDPAANKVVATIDVGVPGPGGDIAAGEGFVWVTAVGVPLTQIDPRENKVVAQYVGTGGDALRIGHRAAWLCSFFLQEVWRVPLPL